MLATVGRCLCSKKNKSKEPKISKKLQFLKGSKDYIYDVNISCNLKDIDWVEHFLAVLEEFHLKCFLYERDKPAGSITTQTLRDSILKSRFTIICCSKNYFLSSWNTHQALLAHFIDPDGRKNRIIPISIDGSELPPKFCNSHMLRWPILHQNINQEKMQQKMKYFWISFLESINFTLDKDTLESVITKSLQR